MRQLLTEIQHDLFDLGGELSIPGYTRIQAEHISRLERVLDHYNADLEPLKEFILPGGSRAGALCHLARTVCRRAERRVVGLASNQSLSPYCQQYLNQTFRPVIRAEPGDQPGRWMRGCAVAKGSQCRRFELMIHIQLLRSKT